MLLKSNTKYVAQYDSKALRGEDDPATPRPWDLKKLIIDQREGRHTLLDVGCGTAFKLFALSPHFDIIYGLDPSESMLHAAEYKLSSLNIKNIKLIRGVGENLPFGAHSVEMVTCMLSRWDVREIHRVLDKNGIAIVEQVGCEDKKEFKQFFGKDEEGWRGQLIDYNLENYLEEYRKLFSTYFETVSIMNGYWDTYYTPRGINELLRHTPTVRNYHAETDQLALDKAIELFNTPQGIKLTQNRVLIYAKNPRIFEI